MSRYTIAFAILFLPLPVLAQDSKEYRACVKKAATQLQMNDCASKESARTDAEMVDIYRRLLAKTTDHPGNQAKIKSAQEAWILYRDAYLDAAYPAKNKQAEYGTVYPMEFALLRAKLTSQQVVALTELLNR